MEQAKIKFSIIIPCFNEEKMISQTVEACARAMQGYEEFEIIVIDDGSSDGSGKILKNLNNITLIENPYNLGYGASLKKGLVASRGEWIIITDADGTYPIDKISELIRYAGQYDMVVGARQTDNDFFLRTPAKWILKKIASFLAGKKIPDLNSGFRIFRKSVAMEFFNLYPSGFSFTSTITLACFSHDYTVKYIDIPYYKRVGKSSIRPSHFFTFLNLILKILLYFNPIKMLTPVALLFLLAGILRVIRDIEVVAHIGSLAIIFLIISFFIFMLSFLMDAVIKSKSN